MDQTPPQPIVISPPPVSKISPFLIFLVILILVLLAATGIFAYQNMQLQKQIAILQSQSTPTPSVANPPLAETPSADPTANWKTYTDSTNKMSFKYPQTWQVEETWGTSGITNFHYLALIKNSVIKYGPEPGAIGITAWDNPKNLSLQEFENTNRGHTGTIGVYDPSAKNVALGDKSAFYSDNANCEPVLCSNYVVSANSKIFFVSIYKDAVKNDQPIVDQILSTFHFLK